MGCSFFLFFYFFPCNEQNYFYSQKKKKKRIKLFAVSQIFPWSSGTVSGKGDCDGLEQLGDGPGAAQEKTRPSQDPKAKPGHSATFGLQVAAAARPSCWPCAPKMLGTQFGLASWMEVTLLPSVQVSYCRPRKRAAGRGQAGEVWGRFSPCPALLPPAKFP